MFTFSYVRARLIAEKSAEEANAMKRLAVLLLMTVCLVFVGSQSTPTAKAIGGCELVCTPFIDPNDGQCYLVCCPEDDRCMRPCELRKCPD